VRLLIYISSRKRSEHALCSSLANRRARAGMCGGTQAYGRSDQFELEPFLIIPTPLKCDSWAGVVLGAWV
jgi:hypothetical protein